MSLRARLVLTVTMVAFLALVVADLVTYSSLRAVLLGSLDTSLQSAHVAIEQSLSGAPPGSAPAGDGGKAARPPGSTGMAARRDGSRPAGSGSQGAAHGSPPAPAPSSGPPSGETLCNESREGAPGAYLEVRTTAGAIVDGDRCPAFLPGGKAYAPQLPARITGFQPESPGIAELVTYFSAPPAERGGPSFRVRASVLDAGQLSGDVLVLALPLTATESTLSGLLDIELAVTAGALAVASGLGWWLVQRGLTPLRRVESTAEAIAGGDYGHRVPGDRARTEVGRVARALNAMLVAIQQAFAERDATEAELRASEGRLRRFVGDASHELRTPIAAVSAYAELFERSAGHQEDLPRLMRGIRVETARMAQLVEDLLLLARLDEHRPLRTARVELVDLAAAAAETARTVGPQWPVSLEAEDAVEVLGDEVQLRQVLDNLLANARAHTRLART
jgi:signal transduction histidine kinase